MATVGSSNTSPRWGRTGEPGSAFNGLSRGGRGRGGGGIRGGRGRARGGLSIKTEHHVSSTKSDNSQSNTSPSTKPSVSPSPSTPAPSTLAPGKPSVPSSKPKLVPRKGPHAISGPQTNESVVAASAPTVPPAKFSHKRRRSQAGKPALHGQPKINLPTLNDSPLQSTNKPHLDSHTKSLNKDLPPHLNSKFDARNDIDALVQRVRAVAMDHRPSTPKSHIDWALDDDDTLPDLDDWGVTTSTTTATQREVISPIIVDGLRSLPECATNSTAPSPLKQVEIDAQSNGDTTAKKLAPSSPRSTKEEDTKSKPSPDSSRTIIPSNSITKTPQPNAGTSLHPSLPAKPLSVDPIQHIGKPLAKASHMRIIPQPSSPIIPVMDLSGMPERVSVTTSEQTGAQEPAEVATEPTDHNAARQTPEPKSMSAEHLIIVEPAVIESVSPDRGSDYTQITQEPSLPGLAASIHAPKCIVDSASAPANLSAYADFRAHDPIHTHTRAHTVGRSPLLDVHGQGDYTSRFTRSGRTTPRGGFQENSHARTHSTPPGGINHRRSPQTSRPVITGDAISRLARTIGKSH